MYKQAAVVAVVLGFFSSPALAAPGEYWEITNKVDMQGISMPGTSNKVCMPKGGEKDPRNSADKSCEMTDVKVFGNKTSWKMRCEKNGEVMTGSGEMSATPDRSEGTITITTKQGSVNMGFVNKRVGGACDSDEMRKKVEAQVVAGNQEIAKMCDSASTSHEWLGRTALVLGKDAVCAAKKDQVCDMMKRDSMRDVEVYFALKADTSVSKGCGFGMDSAKKALCKSVDTNNADFTQQMRGSLQATYGQRLRAECPAEMKAYAEVSRKRYCEGRGFTEKQQMSLATCLKGGTGDDQAMQMADPEEPPLQANNKKAATQASNLEATKAEPSVDNAGAKQSVGISIPGMTGGATISPDAVLDGAKKLKNLFGF